MPGLLQEQLFESRPKCPLLDQRFSILKQSLVEPQNVQKVVQSYKRLCKVLEKETALIAKNGPQMVPEIDFDVIHQNGGDLPPGFVDLVRDRGCVIFRNVVSEQEASAWEAELKDYTKRHKSVGGFPRDNPQNWSLWWTRPQVQIRSHPRVMEAMTAVGKLWHVSDPNTTIDFDSQVAYPDRFRIRYPTSDKEYTLNAHLDSGAIERWEDPSYRANYAPIFTGDWETYDGWNADHRSTANMDLYAVGNSCSIWRGMQGWLSLSHTNTGEGTLRVLPNLKASTAYMMLRPFFVDTEEFDNTAPTFPGATPAKTQFYPTRDFHPHLNLDESIVGIPPVKPGDYVFWHCDLIHEVDKFNPGANDSSVAYVPSAPLTPYNLTSLLGTKKAFQNACPPVDFNNMGHKHEEENEHDDHGAREENLLSTEGRRAMGFEKFDDEEEGISDGQRRMRTMANEKLGFV